MAENPANVESSKGIQGDGTAPSGIQSPGTFVPLNKEPQGVDVKTQRGKDGKD